MRLVRKDRQRRTAAAVGCVSVLLLLLLLRANLFPSEEVENLSVLETCRGRQLYKVDFPGPSEWTVFITINSGFMDFFTNWWYHFERLDTKSNLIIVAEDAEAFQLLKAMDLPGAAVVQSDATGSGKFGYDSPEYNRLVSSRPSRVLSMLCSADMPSANLIYADIDAVWLRDPLPYFQQALYGPDNFDFAAQDDQPESPENYCTGLIVMRRNDKMVHLMAQWEAMLAKFPNSPNQRLFWNTLESKAVQSLNINRGVLPISIFPPGDMYFEEGESSEHHWDQSMRDHVAIAHNNWVIGHENKIARFKKFGLWKVPSS